MIDTQSYLERYRVLPPPEQNRELKELFDCLPEWNKIIDCHGPMVLVRKRREHYLQATALTRGILCQRWSLLLGLSLTTASFKAHFTEQYELF